MKLRNITLCALALGFCACSQTPATAPTEEATPAETPVVEGQDLVAEILEGKEQLDLNKFYWINEPTQYTISGDTLTMTPAEKTDFWMHTMGGDKDLTNAPALLVNTAEKNFTFTVKTNFNGASTMYDQCGPIVYLNSDNWLKASVEFSPEAGMLGSVNNMFGRSDWATSMISPEIKTVWYKVMRHDCDFILSSSLDGEKFDILRFCHVNLADGPVAIGLYACSPGEGASFNAVFTDMQFSKGR